MLVFFDGECGLCDRTVRWLLDHDPEGRLRFAPLQGPTASERLRPYAARLEGVDSLVLLDGRNREQEVLLRSRAVFRVLTALPGHPRRWAWLRFVPAFLTDLGYRLVASVRRRFWGAPDACRAPTAEERKRFLP